MDQDKLINGAINGMVEALDDPYSEYRVTSEAKGFHDRFLHLLKGMKSEIQEQDGYIMIVSQLKTIQQKKQD